MEKKVIFPGPLIKSPLLGLLAVFAYLLAAGAPGDALGNSESAGENGGFKLSLPIACEPGKTCWIANYVDLKPGKGAVDYACGGATYDAPPNDMHKGTDFAIRDMEAMRQGVAVKAAAPGVVIAMRDGMADISYKKIRPSFIKKRECGNAVRIRHDNGMTTQYCHMRRGSVAVRKGDRVSRGRHLGNVGISGLTMFPHLHFQVEHNKKVLDPFAGKNRKKKCGVGENPLWDDETLEALPYQPTAIYNSGFAGEPPNVNKVREGKYLQERIPIKARAIILWADIFNVKKGDEIIIEIADPKKNKLMEKRFRAKKNMARYYIYSGAPRKKSIWRPGTYEGKITLARKNPKPETFTVTKKALVR